MRHPKMPKRVRIQGKWSRIIIQVEKISVLAFWRGESLLFVPEIKKRLRKILRNLFIVNGEIISSKKFPYLRSSPSNSLLSMRMNAFLAPLSLLLLFGNTAKKETLLSSFIAK